MPGYVFYAWSGDTTASTSTLPLVMKKNWSLTATFISATLPFAQNFSFSNTLADYLIGGAAPGGQWDAVGATGGSTVSVSGNALQIAHANGKVTLSRATDFVYPAPGVLVYSFNLSLTGGSGTSSNPDGVLRVGSGFGTANSDEADANTFGKLGINMGSGTNQYQLRNIASGQNSANISGNPVITWVLNKSGNSFSYLAPDGTTGTVGNNRMDVWVGTTLNPAFDEMAVTTSTAAMTDLKFDSEGQPGTFTFDNFNHTTKYALNVTTAGSGSGSVTKSPDQVNYDPGTVVQLTASPAIGSAFSGWSGDATGSANPLSVTMNADQNITATFVAVPPHTMSQQEEGLEDPPDDRDQAEAGRQGRATNSWRPAGRAGRPWTGSGA